MLDELAMRSKPRTRRKLQPDVTITAVHKTQFNQRTCQVMNSQINRAKLLAPILLLVTPSQG